MKTKKNNSESMNTVGKEDRALNLFADMMIEKIESLKGDWKKPWFTEGSLAWPRNLSGREYNGMNTLMLLMHCERNHYQVPVFLTFNRCISLNFKDGADGRVPATDAEGRNLPWVHVLKGEKSFPVFLTTFTVKDKDGNSIKYDDYKQLSEAERDRYTVYPSTVVYDVFNVAQTNIREARPELFAKLQESVQTCRPCVDANGFTFAAFDTMAAESSWICPIRIEHQDNACYSPSRNEILLPEKAQFDMGESFYSTAFHECIHSTGAQLGRLKDGAAFGSPEYAREELVAELGAALVAHRYGFDSHVKEESAAYLKSWLKSLREEPSFIRTTLFDVKRATAVLTQRLDALGAQLAVANVAKAISERTEEALKPKNASSPMMKQFLDLKAKHPDALLLFRCGDFYETYQQDAVDASDILGITLTRRGGTGTALERSMAGFPHHALDTYLPRLIRAGRRVAICDQLEAPKKRKRNAR